MPRNPHKRRCAVPGCRAWAMRGRDVCGSHRSSPSPSEGEGRGEGERPWERDCRDECAIPTLTADYTLDDLAAHAALALNRLQAWYGERGDDPRWVIAYVRQLYLCLARLAELWKQRATMGPDQLNGALAELKQDIDEGQGT